MSERLGPYLLGPNETAENGIYTGDARILSEAIPDKSVDLIFTDPVYQNIDDYRWLAETAARVLKNDSACLTFCGIGYLPETLAALTVGGLHYRWQFPIHIRNKCSLAGSNWTYRNWQCLLWLENGTANPHHRIQDIRSVVAQNWTTEHRWSKSFTIPAISYYLEAFGSIGDVVVDFFAGSGIVPAVCKMLSHQYLAFEIMSEMAKLARDRVRQTQPPLPGLVLESQVSLELPNEESPYVQP